MTEPTQIVMDFDSMSESDARYLATRLEKFINETTSLRRLGLHGTMSVNAVPDELVYDGSSMEFACD